ncbi:hypothetical protein Tco_1512832, partial [Tanacetum coccineum]
TGTLTGQQWPTTVNGGGLPVNHHSFAARPKQLSRRITTGPPQLRRRTADQPSLTSAATSACGSHVSLRGTATSVVWVLLGHVAATSVANVEIAKTTLARLELETSRAGLKGSLKFHLR